MAAYEIFKWLKSENCSNEESKRLANKTRKVFGMTHRQYRKTLSWGRNKVKVLERLMSDNRFDEIEFDKIPSKAGLMYKNAFARRDITAKRYEAFMKDSNTKVNAKALYPYEIVSKVVNSTSYYWNDRDTLSEVDRAALNKYWENLENPFEENGGKSNILCVCDTSGSMCGSQANAPINVAISLSMLCAEHAGGAFKDHYISFSSRPQLIKVEGVDFVDKVRRIYKTNLCENTDLIKTFELLRTVAMQSDVNDIPSVITVISDMEIDCVCHGYWGECRGNSDYSWLLTDMESERIKWESCGLPFPHLVYWNVEARQDNFLDLGPNVTYVSGMSPSIFKQVLTGTTGYDLMLQTLNSSRYNTIK